MSVRNNLYDALEYAGQVEAISRAHKREMEQAKESAKKFYAMGLEIEKIAEGLGQTI